MEPSDSVVADVISSGSNKSFLIVPSLDTVSNDIDRPNPSTDRDLSLDETLVYEGAGSVPGGKISPGSRNLLSSAGLQSSAVHVTLSSNTPNAGIVPVGSDWVPSDLNLVPSPNVLPSLNV